MIPFYYYNTIYNIVNVVDSRKGSGTVRSFRKHQISFYKSCFNKTLKHGVKVVL
jgi:hypothetical protein